MAKPHLGRSPSPINPASHSLPLPSQPSSRIHQSPDHRSVPKLFIKISKPIQVMRTMVVYLLGTSGQSFSIQPAQETNLWSGTPLFKKSSPYSQARAPRFAQFTLQAPISSKSPVRWQRETRGFPSRSPWSPSTPIWAFLAPPPSIRKKSSENRRLFSVIHLLLDSRSSLVPQN